MSGDKGVPGGGWGGRWLKEAVDAGGLTHLKLTSQTKVVDMSFTTSLFCMPGHSLVFACLVSQYFSTQPCFPLFFLSHTHLIWTTHLFLITSCHYWSPSHLSPDCSLSSHATFSPSPSDRCHVVNPACFWPPSFVISLVSTSYFPPWPWALPLWILVCWALWLFGLLFACFRVISAPLPMDSGALLSKLVITSTMLICQYPPAGSGTQIVTNFLWSTVLFLGPIHRSHESDIEGHMMRLTGVEWILYITQDRSLFLKIHYYLYAIPWHQVGFSW